MVVTDKPRLLSVRPRGGGTVAARIASERARGCGAIKKRLDIMDDSVALLRRARVIGSGNSKDPITRVGCILVGSGGEVTRGWNSFPDNVDDTLPERWERPMKYEYCVHAELNAICKAAKTGVQLDGTRCVVSLFPCPECCKALIQAGITEVVAFEPDLQDERWGRKWTFALQLLTEAGVTVTTALRKFKSE